MYTSLYGVNCYRNNVGYLLLESIVSKLIEGFIMKTKIPDAVLAAEVSRRILVKTTAIGGLAMASSDNITLVGLRTLSIAPFRNKIRRKGYLERPYS